MSVQRKSRTIRQDSLTLTVQVTFFGDPSPPEETEERLSPAQVTLVKHPSYGGEPQEDLAG